MSLDLSTLVLKVLILTFPACFAKQGIVFPGVPCACTYLFHCGICPILILTCACCGARAEADHAYRILIHLLLLRRALLLSGLQVVSVG